MNPPDAFAPFLKRACGSKASSNPATFSGFLADTAGRNLFLLAIIDTWTRLFDPKNLIRTKLNATVAFAEIHPPSLERLERPKRSSFVKRLQLLGWLSAYVGTFFVSFPVVGCLYLIWKVSPRKCHPHPAPLPSRERGLT